MIPYDRHQTLDRSARMQTIDEQQSPARRGSFAQMVQRLMRPFAALRVRDIDQHQPLEVHAGSRNIIRRLMRRTAKYSPRSSASSIWLWACRADRRSSVANCARSLATHVT